MRIREIALARPRFGCQRLHFLLRREGWAVNLKRVRRLKRLEGMQVRARIRRRKHRGPAPAPVGTQDRWSMDFVHDQLADAREKIEVWRCDCNQVRPHSSLGHLTPSEFIIQGQDNRITGAAALLH